jgi:hypothetical protein
VAEAGAQSVRHTTQYMQYIQSQQQQMEALKQQLMVGGYLKNTILCVNLTLCCMSQGGASSPWSVQASYRLPETNINSQVTYQQVRVRFNLVDNY